MHGWLKEDLLSGDGIHLDSQTLINIFQVMETQ